MSCLFLTLFYFLVFRLNNGHLPKEPAIIFGDFNFRLDTKSVVEVWNMIFYCMIKKDYLKKCSYSNYMFIYVHFHFQSLCAGLHSQHVRKDGENCPFKIIYRDSKSSDKVIYYYCIINLTLQQICHIFYSRSFCYHDALHLLLVFFYLRPCFTVLFSQ